MTNEYSSDEFCNILECMKIEHSIDSGFAITHFGFIEGQKTIAVSHANGTGIVIQ